MKRWLPLRRRAHYLLYLPEILCKGSRQGIEGGAVQLRADPGDRGAVLGRQRSGEGERGRGDLRLGYRPVGDARGDGVLAAVPAVATMASCAVIFGSRAWISALMPGVNGSPRSTSGRQNHPRSARITR